MTIPCIIDGRLSSPYFIFVRDNQTLGDDDLINRFGLASYQRLQVGDPKGHYVVLADAREWTLIADSWYYNLWHDQKTEPAIKRLAEKFDVFDCSVGDCDLSYSFRLNRNGETVRKLVVESPHFNDQIVTENVGAKLPCEDQIWSCNVDDAVRIQLVAEALGIPCQFAQQQLRIYCIVRGDEN